MPILGRASDDQTSTAPRSWQWKSKDNIILNFVSVPEELALWVGIVTLVPLALLMLSGLYLFVLPYATSRRVRRRTEE